MITFWGIQNRDRAHPYRLRLSLSRLQAPAGATRLRFVHLPHCGRGVSSRTTWQAGKKTQNRVDLDFTKSPIGCIVESMKKLTLTLSDSEHLAIMIKAAHEGLAPSKFVRVLMKLPGRCPPDKPTAKASKPKPKPAKVEKKVEKEAAA